MNIRVNFIIGQISEGDFELLQHGYNLTSKMILPKNDFELFHYKVGDDIQVETDHGNRLWCKILDLETLEEGERILLIFTLRSDRS